MHDATDQRSNRVVLLISHLAAIYMHDRMYRHTRMKFFTLETFSASVVLEHALLLLIFITRICCAVFNVPYSFNYFHRLQWGKYLGSRTKLRYTDNERLIADNMWPIDWHQTVLWMFESLTKCRISENIILGRRCKNFSTLVVVRFFCGRDLQVFRRHVTWVVSDNTELVSRRPAEGEEERRSEAPRAKTRGPKAETGVGFLGRGN